jgi:segregation and condensation protein B
MTSENEIERMEDQAAPEPPATQAGQEVPDDTDQYAQEIDAPTDADREAAPEANEPIGEDEDRAVDQTSTRAQEDEVSHGEGTPLTPGERQIDQVIDVLLGEPQEAPAGEDEPAEESQAATEVQEPPAEVQTQGQEATPQPELVPTTESVLEAVLFATDEPLTESKLAGIVETTAKQVRESIESLNAKYVAENHAFRIEQIAGGYQMLTLNTYNFWLKKMLRARGDSKLSPAAMETLAIIAYKQPIIRADIEAIRGVAVGEVIRSLMYKGLVKITGRAEILGRPMLYGTTKKFLEIFGLNSLKDLPKAEELKNPDRG